MITNFSKPVFRPDSLSTGLVGYWKFNNGVTDSSGKGYDLTAGAGAAAPTFALIDYWKSGEYSTDFKAADNEYYTITRNADLDCLNAFSIAGWIYADDITSVAIVDKDSVGNGYGVQLDGSSKLVLNINNGARATSATAVAAARWTHFACVYDQTTARVYLDGNLENSAAYSTDAADEAVDFRLGSLADGSLDYDGKLKDLAIWSVALTPIQVKSLALGIDLSKYAYRPNHVSTQPTHWWKLNEVSGDRSDSVSTNPLTLTDNNTVLSSGGYVEGVSALFSAAASESLSNATVTDFAVGTDDFTFRVRLNKTAGAATANIFGTSYSDGFMVDIVGGTDVTVYMGGGAAKLTRTCITSASWQDVVLRRSGTNLTLWVDGIQQGATVTNSTNLGTPTGPFSIGFDASSDHFNGLMEDFAFWKGYALTDAEIKSLACALPIQRQGIVSYWKMEGATAGDETDSIGSNTLVATAGAGELVTATGQVSKGRDFEATEEAYFTVANNDSIDIASDFTLMGWWKSESSTAGELFYKGTADYAIQLGADNKHVFYSRGTGFTSATVFVNGTFAHLVGTHDGAYAKTYVDGVNTLSTADTTLPNDTAGALTVGATAVPGTYADGIADELMLWKRYARPEEIKAVYLKGLNGKEVTTSERSGFIPRGIVI
jgi:hypothetical protein